MSSIGAALRWGSAQCDISSPPNRLYQRIATCRPREMTDMLQRRIVVAAADKRLLCTPFIKRPKRLSRLKSPKPLHALAQEGVTIVAPTSSEWQLDFCSRPILDERGKKVWELLICDASRSFEYSQYFPNNKINSTELKRAIQDILELPGANKPEKVRFFRAQMQTIITRALSDLEIAPIPSRRCFALTAWLQEREETVYKVHPGYNEKAATMFTLDLGSPEELPDALRGESWAFVQLPLSALRGELVAVETGKSFGSTLDLENRALGLENVNDDMLIPGVAVYSRRADPLAAWTNGLELAAVSADTDRAFLILETGVNQRWRYGAYQRTLESTAEAQAWEAAKRAAGGLHFLTIMTSEDAEDCAGLWLLLDKEAPRV